MDVDEEQERKRLKKERKAAKKAAKAALAAVDRDNLDLSTAAVASTSALPYEQQQQVQVQEQPHETNFYHLGPPATDEEIMRILSTAPALEQHIDPQLQQMASASHLMQQASNEPSTSKASIKKTKVPTAKAAAKTAGASATSTEAKRGRKRGTIADYSHLTAEEILTTHWIDLKKINQLAEEMGQSLLLFAVEGKSLTAKMIKDSRSSAECTPRTRMPPLTRR